MAAPIRLLVNTLLRQAQQNTNPQNYLQTFLLGTLSNVTDRGGAQIVSVSVNGKTTSLQVPAGGWSESDVMGAAEYALQLMEAGATRVPSRARVMLQ